MCGMTCAVMRAMCYDMDYEIEAIGGYYYKVWWNHKS